MRQARLLRGLVVAALVLAPAVAARAAAEARMSGTGTALVVIDIQEFYFAGGRLALVGPIPASEQARRVLDRFRALHLPVIHVQHRPKDQAAPAPDSGDPQYRIHANVLPLPGEIVVGKHYANAFRDTDLLARLRGLGVTRLVICGMQTHMCVEAAARAAADLGFDVTVVHDACATRDLAFAGTTVPAAQVHAAALAAMSGTYARIASADEVLAELK